MSGEEIKRPPICHGDGRESERLYGLGAGHVLTEADIKDIQNLIADNNDEIGNTVEIMYQSWQQALEDSAPDKVELINRIGVLEVKLATEKALRKFDQGMYERKLKSLCSTSS